MPDEKRVAFVEPDHPVREAIAIKHCLLYLEEEASRLQLALAANLIGAAAEAIAEALPSLDRSGFPGDVADDSKMS